MSEREVTEREVVAYFAEQAAAAMAYDRAHGQTSPDSAYLECAGADDISPRLQREVLAEARRMLAAGSSPLAADDDGETVPDEIAEQLWQDAYEALHEFGDYWIGNQDI